MATYEEVLDKIANEKHREYFEAVIAWVQENYPKFNMAIKWSQPLFEFNNSFIIGFTANKHHLSVTSEKGLMAQVNDKVEAAGYATTAMSYKVPWDAKFNYDLLDELIQIQLNDKKDLNRYWRQPK
ncbi:iron chaperone [Fundicoccus sp. Sow4_H7]|uniref:iron chaperone n=1 Tax=Fundicoccus sp. Sow4_H7 TaxID=3438784 RepID=UPI003F904C1A